MLAIAPKLTGMAKKKRPSGKHKTRRVSVQLPEPWLKAAREQAAKGPTPTVWYLVSLIKRDLEQSGRTDIPVAPWEEDS